MLNEVKPLWYMYMCMLNEVKPLWYMYMCMLNEVKPLWYMYMCMLNEVKPYGTCTCMQILRQQKTSGYGEGEVLMYM